MAQIPYRALATEDFKRGDLVHLIPQDFADENAKVEACRFVAKEHVNLHGIALFDAKKGEYVIFVAGPMVLDLGSAPDEPYYLKEDE